MVGDAKNAPALAGAEDELVEATRLAWQWHGRQTRKGRSSSYMSHLLQVQGLVIDAGGDAIQSIAALLHDSLEDAPTARDRAEREALIATRFDPAVLQIVIDCTDTTAAESADDKGPWRERKERYLAQLRIAAPSSLLVAACDKRHNLGDLIRDLRQEGLETLSRFNAGGVEQLWYFESLSAICGPAIPDRLARELDDLVRALRAIVETGTIDGD